MRRTLLASSRQTPLFRCFALRNAESRFVAAPPPQKSCDFRGPLLTTGRAHRLRPPYRRGCAALGRILSAPAVSRQFSAAQKPSFRTAYNPKKAGASPPLFVAVRIINFCNKFPLNPKVSPKNDDICIKGNRS